MNNKIYILFILLFINIILTIYLLYNCFNNKITEGISFGSIGKSFKSAGKSIKDISKDAGKAIDNGVDAAKKEADRIAEETRKAEDLAKQEANRIAEEARQALEKLMFESFDKLLNQFSVFFSTLQNTTLILEKQGGN